MVKGVLMTETLRRRKKRRPKTKWKDACKRDMNTLRSRGDKQCDLEGENQQPTPHEREKRRKKSHLQRCIGRRERGETDDVAEEYGDRFVPLRVDCLAHLQFVSHVSANVGKEHTGLSAKLPLRVRLVRDACAVESHQALP